MIVNRSMYPIQAGFSAITKMQDSIGKLQTQLGSGKQATTLAEEGSNRHYSLSIRDQLNKFTGYSNTMDTVGLRLSMLDNTFSRLDEIEGDTRTSMTPNAYGDDGLNLVQIPKAAHANLDEVLTLLNTNVNGRYLLGGNQTEKPPVPTIDELLNGTNGQDGFNTIVNERNAADMGADGMGRTVIGGAGPDATLSEDGVQPFGFKMSTVSDTSDAIDTSVTTTQPPQTTIDLTSAADGDTVSLTLKTRDGASQVVTLKAVTGTPGAGEFQIGATPADTAANFSAALNGSVKGATDSLVGNPATYESDVGSNGLGRLNISSTGGTVTLAEDGVDASGLSIASAATTGGLTATGADGTPGVSGKAGSVDVNFNDVPHAGESITINLTLPDGTSKTLKMTATNDDPTGPDAFKIGADADETAANFRAALATSLKTSAGTDMRTASSFAAADNFFNGHGQPVLRVSGNPATATGLETGTAATTVQWYTGQDSDTPRQTVTAQIDDGTRVAYGVQANEAGLALLVKTLAVASVTTYPPDDDTSKARYDALATRQMANMSESHNDEDGSIEIIATELGITQNTIGKVADRQTAYSGQLNNMLADAENVTTEDVAMQLLAVKTRLEASYAATASISQLSLANYLK
ncbi:MAG TPA: hypothetical protein VGM83_04715 [Devosiaceae bacterium]